MSSDPRSAGQRATCSWCDRRHPIASLARACEARHEAETQPDYPADGAGYDDEQSRP